MVKWKGIFWLFRFSGVLRQPREVNPKFKNEIPNNVCSIRSPTLNLRNFWSSGKLPKSRGEFRDLHSTFRLRALRYCNLLMIWIGFHQGCKHASRIRLLLRHHSWTLWAHAFSSLSLHAVYALTEEKTGKTNKLPKVSLKFLLLDHHTDNRSQYQPVDYCSNNKVDIDTNWTKVPQTENMVTQSETYASTQLKSSHCTSLLNEDRSLILGACNYLLFLSRRFHRPIYF